MSYQNIFKRYEIKYLITQEQKKDIIEAMEPYMQLDEYGRTTIRNVYLDTDNYRLIRNSLEKPMYKEKIRVRSYRQVGDEDIVFVELKKKYDSVVYKRRVEETEEKAKEWLCDKKSMRLNSQIEREISYFIEYYGNLLPKVFLSYEREAFFSLDGSDFRVTFDDNILWRQDNISLKEKVGGNSIIGNDEILMELKTSKGIPLWMTDILSKNKLYKTSFSKYGRAYMDILNRKNMKIAI